MTNLENINAPDILGITDQQLNLLKTVYKITSKNKVATPRDIEHTYAKDHPSGIQKSNLFRQLKILLDKKYMIREGEANYQLNFDGIKKTLDNRKDEYKDKLSHYEQLTNEVEEYFRRTTVYSDRPFVEYLGFVEIFNKISERMTRIEKFYVTSRFPTIAYNYDLAKALKIEKYLNSLLERCIKKQDMSLSYLTNLDIKYLFNQHLRAGFKRKQALRGCENSINTIENFMEEYPNIKLYLQEQSLGLDIMITESETPEELYLFLRGEKNYVIGGIHIRSKNTIETAKHQFQDMCTRTKEIKKDTEEKNKKDVFENLRATLRSIE